jgi:hypothetical protein
MGFCEHSNGQDVAVGLCEYNTGYHVVVRFVNTVLNRM